MYRSGTVKVHLIRKPYKNRRYTVYRWWDSNPHSLGNAILNRARLPIPPHRLRLAGSLRLASSVVKRCQNGSYCCPLGGPRISPRTMASRAAAGVERSSRIGLRRLARWGRTTSMEAFLTRSRATFSAGLREGLGLGEAARVGGGGVAPGRGGGEEGVVVSPGDDPTGGPKKSRMLNCLGACPGANSSGGGSLRCCSRIC